MRYEKSDLKSPACSSLRIHPSFCFILIFLHLFHLLLFLWWSLPVLFLWALSISPVFSVPADSARGSQACIDRPGPVAVQQECSAQAGQPSSGWTSLHLIQTYSGSSGLWPLGDTVCALTDTCMDSLVCWFPCLSSHLCTFEWLANVFVINKADCHKWLHFTCCSVTMKD